MIPDVSDVPWAGYVRDDAGALRDLFVDNFRPRDDDPGDLGAGLCVIHRGSVVIDVTGGWRDLAATTPFDEHTLVNAYSVGKGVTAAIALAAVTRGLIDLDAPVREHWTDFALPTTLRHHLSHQVGLPALRTPAGGGAWDDGLPLDWHRMCAALAATEPWWEPGSAHGYHVNTAGFLAGEPVRAAAGATRFGDLLRDWFAEPLDADLWFGVPPEEHHRCSTIAFTGGTTPMPPTSGGAEFPDERSRMRHHAYFNPRTISGMTIVESAEWRSAEVPSTNLHATARGVAKLYASLLDPQGPVAPELVSAAARTVVDGNDEILDSRSRFGLGFQLHLDHRAIGVSPSSFGHFGFGGSLGFVDPDHRIAVGYVLNRPGDRWQIPRTKRLLAALRDWVADH